MRRGLRNMKDATGHFTKIERKLTDERNAAHAEVEEVA
jgi:hypothetical protein